MKRDIETWFTYHPPTAEDQVKYNAINSAAKHLAEVIADCCPMCADAMDAVRKVREARMTANAAIACAPKVVGYAGMGACETASPMREASDEEMKRAAYRAIEKNKQPY